MIKKRLFLRELEKFDFAHNTYEVRLLETMIDQGDNPAVSIQFWQDVKTYGLREAFVYLVGYMQDGLWVGKIKPVLEQVNKMLELNDREVMEF